MAYIANTDIETRLGTARYVQLTDDSGSGTADAAVVEEARSGAERLTDSYLGRRYAVPLDVTADPALAALLKSLVLDLVEHRLHARRPPVPPDVIRRYAAALGWLEAVARGSVVLPSAAALAGNPTQGVRAATIGNDRLLSREELSDY